MWLSDSLISWREVLRLLLLSAVFTLTAVYAFPRNAPSRRALLLTSSCALVFLPWIAAALLEVWVVPVVQQPELTLAESVPNFLLILWLGVAAILLSLQLHHTYREARSIQRLDTIGDSSLGLEVRNLATALDMPWPQLKLGEQACASTLLRTTLVLPPQWCEWDRVTLRGVVAHELVHIQRKDDQWLLLNRVLVLGYWWMPWLRYFYRTHIQVMEESCDDAASELVGHQLNYVGALARAAGAGAGDAACNSVPHTIPGMHQHHLVGRIGRFGRPRIVELDTGSVYWSVLVILVLVLGLTAIEPREPQPVYTVAGSSGLSVPLPSNRISDAPMATFPEVLDRVSFPGVVNASTRARALAPTYHPPAIYPGSAIRAKLEGDITVAFSISKDGSVSHAEVVGGDTTSAFAVAALRAVRLTRYQPDYMSHSSAISEGARAENHLQTTRGTQRRARLSSQPRERVQRIFRFRLRSDQS